MSDPTSLTTGNATAPRMVPLRKVVIYGLLIVLLVVVVGFVHVVHGGAVGLKLCAKDGWALDDTFVDLDDYIGKPLISQIAKAKVLRAMFACEVLRRPGIAGDDTPSRSDSSPWRSGASKVKTTKIKLTQYANEAFPQWSASHPDKECPDKITDLNEYMNSSDANDAWGRPIKMLCGPSLPASKKGGIVVISIGEDGREGTADDLRSWED